MTEGMKEAGVVIGNDGEPAHWHSPDGRSSAYLPDSVSLWEVLRDGRDEIAGYAHTHPGGGRPGPSVTDVTTFSAVERGLGKRFKWWISSSDETVLVFWTGPDKHDYGVEPVADEPPWVAGLRSASGM